MILASITSIGPHRHRQQVLHRAALALARDRQRGDEQRREHQDDADEPRHDVEHGQLLGIVAGMDHELEGRRLRLGCAGSAAGRGRARVAIAASAAVALPMATGSVASASIRIGGFSPRSTERSKLRRNVDDEEHVAPRQRLVGRGLGAKRADVVIAGVLAAPRRGCARISNDRPRAARSAGAWGWC